jgi:hypothetical protein
VLNKANVDLMLLVLVTQYYNGGFKNDYIGMMAKGWILERYASMFNITESSVTPEVILGAVKSINNERCKGCIELG